MGDTAVRGRYDYPATDDYTEKVHSPEGVIELSKNAKIMQLLRQLSADGYDVSAAAAELVALLNYVTCTQVILSDLDTHLAYCLEKARENLAKQRT